MDERRMTADAELLPLPLPEPFVSDLMHGDLYTPEQVRANIAHATAAKDAEIEALRAEVDEWKRRGEAYFQTAERQGKSAERLAEALREAADMLLADYPETAKRLRAALHPAAAQENDDA